MRGSLQNSILSTGFEFSIKHERICRFLQNNLRPRPNRRKYIVCVRTQRTYTRWISQVRIFNVNATPSAPSLYVYMDDAQAHNEGKLLYGEWRDCIRIVDDATHYIPFWTVCYVPLNARTTVRIILT